MNGCTVQLFANLPKSGCLVVGGALVGLSLSFAFMCPICDGFASVAGERTLTPCLSSTMLVSFAWGLIVGHGPVTNMHCVFVITIHKQKRV